MSTNLTLKAPLPRQTFQLAGASVTSDANGLITNIAAGSELAKALIDYGCTLVAALPTVDPHVSGAVWNNGGTLAISAG